MRIRICAVFLFAVLFSQIGTFGMYDIANAQSEIQVPDWIRQLAKFWSDGDISDKEFASAIEYLIKSKIITSNRITIIEENENIEAIEQEEIKIPEWIRNNAKWFSEETIEDLDFVLGIEYMVEKQIIKSPRIQILELPTAEETESVLDEFETIIIVDLDEDGIFDDVDVCPDQAETINGFEDSDGCPDVVPVLDSDNDGIFDDVDVCPDQAETINGFEDSDGCPDVVPVLDSDNDGIFDDDDVCPDQAETINGFEDSDGCPDVVPVLDSDNDGIFDDVDVCPDQAETINGFEDSDGCPDTMPSLPDKSLSIADSNITWKSSGWGDSRITVSWVYTVDHVDENGAGFPINGHFVVEITGVDTPKKAEFDGGNTFSGSYNKVDPGVGGGTIVVKIISFVGDNRGNYVGDGDKKEIVIPPFTS